MGAVLGGAVTVVIIIAFFPILGALFGCFVGFVVGWVLDDTFNAWLAYFGLSNMAPWQVGGMLGFVGPFFRSYLSGK